MLMDGDQQMRRSFHVPTTGLACDPNTASGIDALLTIQRQSINVLCDEDVRDKADAYAGLGNHLRRQGRDDRRMRPCAADIHRADDLMAVELAGLIFDLFGDLLADL